MKRNASRFCACLFAVLFCASALVSCAESAKHEETFFALDTYNTITVYGDESALAPARKAIEEGEALFSNTDPDSEITKINQNAGYAVSVSKETADLIRLSCELSYQTKGAFDITITPLISAYGFYTGDHRVPDQDERSRLCAKVDYRGVAIAGNTVTIGSDQALDLGAIAKGYLADRCAEALSRQGITSAIISLGGNVRVLGGKPDGSAFTVAITDPMDPSSFVGYVRIKDASLVTSGAYQRNFCLDGKFYHHILDPKSGLCANSGLLSVSVLCDSGAKADALSTACFVLGETEALRLWRESGDFELILVREDGTIVVTAGIGDRFVSGVGEDREILYINP